MEQETWPSRSPPFEFALDHHRPKNILSENVLPILLDNERNGSGRAASGCEPGYSIASLWDRLPCWRIIFGSGALRNDDLTGSENLIRLADRKLKR